MEPPPLPPPSAAAFNRAIHFHGFRRARRRCCEFCSDHDSGSRRWPISMTVTVPRSTTPATYRITITGSGGGLQKTATVALAVTAAPSFTLSASPASLSIQKDSQGSSTITTTIRGGLDSSISLAASGTPMGVSVAFAPQTISAPGAGQSTMTFMVLPIASPGTYPITVTGSGAGVQQTATVSLTVTAASSFALSAPRRLRASRKAIGKPPP